MIVGIIFFAIGYFLGTYHWNKNFRARFNSGVHNLFVKIVNSIDSGKKTDQKKDATKRW